jgi:hypothetical protein
MRVCEHYYNNLGWCELVAEHTGICAESSTNFNY